MQRPKPRSAPRREPQLPQSAAQMVHYFRSALRNRSSGLRERDPSVFSIEDRVAPIALRFYQFEATNLIAGGQKGHVHTLKIATPLSPDPWGSATIHWGGFVQENQESAKGNRSLGEE